MMSNKYGKEKNGNWKGHIINRRLIVNFLKTMINYLYILDFYYTFNYDHSIMHIDNKIYLQIFTFTYGHLDD